MLKFDNAYLMNEQTSGLPTIEDYKHHMTDGKYELFSASPYTRLYEAIRLQGLAGSEKILPPVSRRLGRQGIRIYDDQGNEFRVGMSHNISKYNREIAEAFSKVALGESGTSTGDKPTSQDKYKRYDDKQRFDPRGSKYGESVFQKFRSFVLGEAEEEKGGISHTNIPTLNVPLINIGQLNNIIRRAYLTVDDPGVQPPMIWGPVGVGKTQAIRQAAASLNVGCIVLVLTQIDVADLNGLLMISDDHILIHSFPALLPVFDAPGHVEVNRKRFDLPFNEMGGILFLDELAMVPRDMITAANKILQERQAGDHKLAPDWMPIAASNRPIDRPGVEFISDTAAMTRLQHYEVLADFDQFKTWGEQECGVVDDGRVIPPRDYTRGQNILPVILDFLKKHDDLLHNVPISPDMGQLGTDDVLISQAQNPTPRSWHAASDYIKFKIDKLYRLSSRDPERYSYEVCDMLINNLQDLEQEMRRNIASYVGLLAADKFLSFVRDLGRDHYARLEREGRRDEPK